jgi:RimJ/RimL family protein N-acetyltransferase/nitroimidazol reductase NimA-like FMN-containing flavoprotein (pyridoxamine 5'-phosphate oxidase superfamily)
MGTYSRTERTTALRDKKRVSYDVDVVHAILDEAYFCHLAFSTPDGEPRVLPTLHARIDDTLYVHGSTGSRPMLGARPEGIRVCVAVTHLDGLVLARSQFNHSANYRSVVAHGTARPVTDEAEKLRVLTAFADKAVPGRAADSRPPTAKEMAQTSVLALPLDEVSAKVRTGGAIDEPEDLDLPYWAGVVPLRTVLGRPIPDTSLPLPSYLRRPGDDWHTLPELRGRQVTLEPLELTHAEDLLAALDDERVWAHLPIRRPTSTVDMEAVIAGALDTPDRLPILQRSTETGEVIGTTSYLFIDPVSRSVEIGWTALGPKWWRTGANRDAKLLLMTRAFEVLGATRVSWKTDIRNERSQRAIEGLGAVREGVIRNHRPRPDGSMRDSVLYSMTPEEWPAAKAKLAGVRS